MLLILLLSFAHAQSVDLGPLGGTVTSVGLTVPTFLSVSGSPVTTSGTLAVTYSSTPLPVAHGGTGTATAGTGGEVPYTGAAGVFQFDAGLSYGATTGIYVNYGITIDSSPAQPACTISNRGQEWIIQGGAGVADVFQICQKDAGDAYAWATH